MSATGSMKTCLPNIQPCQTLLAPSGLAPGSALLLIVPGCGAGGQVWLRAFCQADSRP
jgi:hypothetical protein